MRNRLTRNLLFGAAFVGLLCNVVSAETVEEALARLSEKAKANKTVVMTVVTSMEGNGMKMEQNTTSKQSRDGEKVLIYAETSGSMSMPGLPAPQTMKSKIVGDGEFLWNEQEQMGQKMVTKMKMPPEAMDPATAYKNMVKEGTATVKENASVEGADCTVLEVKGQGMTSLIYIANDNGVMMKMEGTGDDGTKMTMTAKDVKVNSSLDGVTFTYTPPEGVQVMDMSAMDMGGMGSAEPAAEVPSGS